ncbi:MAG: helix-turn-helix transcriptional regulator [Lachnospiraceae bacterium]|nr:helix-turn-helix transcriptional regulator [Lachnospiraceae bacterium]
MEKEIAWDSIGEILRLLRISYDLSISELSEKTNISKSYITEIEKGVKTPSEKIIKRYSIGLEISEDTLNYFFKSYSHKHLPYQKLLMEILRKISKL